MYKIFLIGIIILFLITLSSSKIKALSEMQTPASNQLKCNGQATSSSCKVVLSFGRCQNQIELNWQPVQFAGNNQWSKQYQNWCELKYSNASLTEVKKITPAHCANVLNYLQNALNIFSHRHLNDAVCENNQTADGLLQVSQANSAHPEQNFNHAVGLADANDCELKMQPLVKGRKRVLQKTLQCKVLRPHETQWLADLVKEIDVKLVVKNQLK